MALIEELVAMSIRSVKTEMYDTKFLDALKRLVDSFDSPKGAESVVAIARPHLKRTLSRDYSGRTIVRALSYLTNNLHGIRAVIIGPRGRLGYVGLKWRKTLGKPS